MRRIIETLLEEGIDESTIHKVLDLIEEEYEVVDETSDEYKVGKIKKSLDKLDSYDNAIEFLEKTGASNKVIQDLKTDLIQKKHKTFPQIEKLKQQQINKLQKEKDNKKFDKPKN